MRRLAWQLFNLVRAAPTPIPESIGIRSSARLHNNPTMAEKIARKLKSAPVRLVRNRRKKKFSLTKSMASGSKHIGVAKDIIVRVSVGGPENAETKIAKSKAIAQKALLRLRSES